MSRIWIVLALLIGTSANAQLAYQPISVYPANLNPDAPFLILVEDSWIDGCGGSVALRVSPGIIEVEATLASPILGRVCTAVLVPFKRLINPRDLVGEDFEFADSVSVNYLVNNGNGPELRYTRQISFGAGTNPATRAQAGGWVTPELASSGLFIDQQGEILSAALFDYGDDNLGNWYYAAGPVNGNVFVGDMSAFGLIQCITQPCERAAPVSNGRINILLRGANEAIVEFSQIEFPGSVLQSGEDAVVYHRLDFTRSPGLPSDPLDGDLALPDLVGSWVGGMASADLGVDDFRTLRVSYAGFDNSHGVAGHRFDVFNGNATAGDPSFQIYCADLRPVDGNVGCSLQGYRFGSDQGSECTAEFRFADVGEERLRASAVCGGSALEFELYRR
ncbi:MAG: hypothetical protein KDI71_09535 [Xanthomonadales bacterium]|nr:hypothetical protein [Xanthomonadales bacterium]